MRVVRTRGWLALAAGLVGFLGVVVLSDPPPADPTTDVPERARLASLIQREQDRTEALRAESQALRADVDALTGVDDDPGVRAQLESARARAGLAPVTGPGLEVTLTDSSLPRSPSGNRNDLLIHSGDVHAVVNGLWEAGAQAIAVNDERVVATSALLCVGNTLLINGTVHSPPYEFVAVGPPEDMRSRFEDDPLVERFAEDASQFELGFDVEVAEELTVPGFEGSVNLSHAEPR